MDMKYVGLDWPRADLFERTEGVPPQHRPDSVPTRANYEDHGCEAEQWPLYFATTL